MSDQALREFFVRTNSLARLCTQNGWPDPQTLAVMVMADGDDGALCSVSFEEVVMEGAGCVAGRVPCWGRYRVRWDGAGGVVQADLVVGARDGD